MRVVRASRIDDGAGGGEARARVVGIETGGWIDRDGIDRFVRAFPRVRVSVDANGWTRTGGRGRGRG